MSAYNEVKRESKPALQTPGIPHLQSHMSAPVLTENPGGASQTHGISEISYLNVNYQGPLAWEVQRARANRQNFQNTLQTIMATNAKLKNIFIIDDCQFFINEVMMYLLVDNGTVGFKKLQEQVGKLGQLTSRAGAAGCQNHQPRCQKKFLARSAKKIDLVKMRLPKFCPESRNSG